VKIESERKALIITPSAMGLWKTVDIKNHLANKFTAESKNCV